MALRDLFAAQGSELPEQVHLFFREVLWGLNVNMHVEVSPPSTLQLANTQALESDGGTRVGSWAHINLLASVEGLHGGYGAKCGCRHGNLERAMKVISPALKNLVLAFANLQVEVSARSATRACIPSARKPDASARLNTCRNVDGNRAPFTRPALTRALGARLLDDRAVTTASAAWGGCHDLAK